MHRFRLWCSASEAGENPVQRVGERLFFAVTIRRLTTTHLPLVAQVGEQVTHGEPVAHVLRVEFFTARIQRSNALLDQPIGQRHIAANHQFAGHGMFNQIIVRSVRAAGHHDQFNQGVRGLDLTLPGNQHHLKLTLERELDDLFFCCLGASVGIDPDAHDAPRSKMDTSLEEQAHAH